MGLLNVFDIAVSGLSAQSLRLTTTASNLSNAEVPASSTDAVYKAKYPVFEAVMRDAMGQLNNGESLSQLSNSPAGVKIAGAMESQAAPRKTYQPGNPMADKDGFVYMSNVNVM